MTKDIVTQDLKYSAYYWHFNQSSNEFELYLDHYVNIDSTGKFVLMRHESWMEDPKYFTSLIDDTLSNLINSAFANKSYKTNYSYSTDNSIYDGLSYCFDYNIDDINRKIFFIPQNTPDEIRKLCAFLDTFIVRTNATKIDTLMLENYIHTLETSDSARPNRPSPPKIEVRAFKQKKTE